MSDRLSVDVGQRVECLGEVFAEFGRGEDLSIGAEFEEFGKRLFNGRLATTQSNSSYSELLCG
jgi:hypothetical protein